MMSLRNSVAPIFLMVLLFTFAAETSAELPVEKFESLKSDESIKLWVHGVGVGFSWANVALIHSKNKPLYCPPAQLYLGADNYLNILVRQLDAMKKASTDTTPMPPKMEIEPILLLGLQNTFPCPK